MTLRTNPQLIYYSTANMSSQFTSLEQSRDADHSVVMITVESISGAPSAATISPKFQIWHSNVGGNQEEVETGGSAMDPANSWMTLSAASKLFLLPAWNCPTARRGGVQPWLYRWSTRTALHSARRVIAVWEVVGTRDLSGPPPQPRP